MARQQDDSLMKQHQGKNITELKHETTLETSQPPPASTAPMPSQPQLKLDDSAASCCYANFCRVTGTPEELILDFGLNSQSAGVPASVEIQQRLVVNYFTAKRLLNALAVSIQRHETAFGMLETDVQKRVTNRGVGRAARGVG